LHNLFLSEAEIDRGEFKRMPELGNRTAVTVLSALVKCGLPRSDTPKANYALVCHCMPCAFIFQRYGWKLRRVVNEIGPKPLCRKRCKLFI